MAEICQNRQVGKDWFFSKTFCWSNQKVKNWWKLGNNLENKLRKMKLHPKYWASSRIFTMQHKNLSHDIHFSQLLYFTKVVELDTKNQNKKDKERLLQR